MPRHPPERKVLVRRDEGRTRRRVRLQPFTARPGMGSPCPHLRRDCLGTPPPTSAPGLTGLTLAHICTRTGTRAAHIRAGTVAHPAHIRTGTRLGHFVRCSYGTRTGTCCCARTSCVRSATCPRRWRRSARTRFSCRAARRGVYTGICVYVYIRRHIYMYTSLYR